MWIYLVFKFYRTVFHKRNKKNNLVKKRKLKIKEKRKRKKEDKEKKKYKEKEKFGFF